jgi:ElaB/YqjD/DUF883 family membrane-anchored ribosome-binding protein
MDNEAEVIKEQMEDTRSSLARKVENLENKVVGTIEQTTSAVSETVEKAKDAVEGTVDTVKESVTETVETVKGVFDFPAHFRRYPWLAFGGSVAAGFMAGKLLHGMAPRLPWPYHHGGTGGGTGRPHATGFPSLSAMTQPSPAAPSARNGGAQESRPAAEPARQEEKKDEGPGLLGKLFNALGPEADKLKGLAIGAALGVVRDMIKQSASRELGSQLADMVNDLTTRLGGRVIHEPLVEKKPQGPHRAGSEFTPARPAL